MTRRQTQESTLALAQEIAEQVINDYVDQAYRKLQEEVFPSEEREAVILDGIEVLMRERVRRMDLQFRLSDDEVK